MMGNLKKNLQWLAYSVIYASVVLLLALLFVGPLLIEHTLDHTQSGACLEFSFTVREENLNYHRYALEENGSSPRRVLLRSPE